MILCPQLGASGRLGNQLWQLASTLGIAWTQGDDAVFPRWAYEPYFNVPEHYFVSQLPAGGYVEDYVPHIDSRARIYLQDYHLWEHMASTLREYFQPSGYACGVLLQDARIQTLQALPHPVLSVHVRRGDNATEGPWKAQYHPLRPESYYREAIAIQLERYGCQSVAVFSDDIAWCQQTFADVGTFFFEGGVVRPKEHEPEYATAPVLDWIDFFAMALYCDAHVVSNSTYSWWAAFLSGSESPAYPWPWFGPALDYIDASLMTPPHWRKVIHSC